MRPSTASARTPPQDIVKFFFDREWNRVTTDTSLDYFFNGEAGKRRMRLAELRPASRLAQLKPERLVQPKIRKAFPDTAFWAADVTTDANGRAHAKVDFPDSLTTWRATTRGVTRVHRRRQRHAQNHRAQESDPAPGRPALLRSRRRSGDLRAGP